MSSNAYSAHLTPDPWLRIIVLTSGRLLVAAGLVVILTLDLDALLRAVACCIWFGIGRAELAQLERGFKACKGVRLSSNGDIAVLDDTQQWHTASMQTGSLVLQNLAWLCLRTANGDRCVELLRGNSRQSEEWRRLQVIWRHVGASS